VAANGVKPPRKHHFLDLAGLADFFVVDHAVGHVFAHFRRAGRGERAFVVIREFAFADGDEFVLWFPKLAKRFGNPAPP
jgi:hypothetical protein